MIATATITEWSPVGGPTGQPVPGGTSLSVDFNPKSLALTHRSIGPRGRGSIRSDRTIARQKLEQTGFTISLSLDLVFDSTVDGTSVQLKTEKLAGLATPHPLGLGKTPPPAKFIRFSWGEFLFFGSITSMTQTLTFFSEWGTPLRAEVHLSLDGVEVQGDTDLSSGVNLSAGPVSGSFGVNAALAPAAAALIAASAAPVGTTAYAQSQAGDTVSAMTARSGSGGSWKSVAAANGIDNPRLLPPGTVIDPNATVQH